MNDPGLAERLQGATDKVTEEQAAKRSRLRPEDLHDAADLALQVLQAGETAKGLHVQAYEVLHLYFNYVRNS